MAITQFTKDMAIIKALADLPNATDGLTAAQLKDKFDEGGLALKAYINATLIAAIEAHMNDSVINDAHGWLSAARFKVGSFTRSTTTASGTQAITGVGFKPKAIICFAVVGSGIGRASWGFADGTTHGLIEDNSASTLNTYSLGSFLIFIRQGATSSVQYSGTLSSFDNDGFTINWTKSVSAVDGETINVQYFAFR